MTTRTRQGSRLAQVIASGVPSHAARLYAVLWLEAVTDATPTYEWDALAAAAGVSRRHAFRAAKDLEDAGVIIRTSRPFANPAWSL